MSYAHAVVWTDHHHAEFIAFDRETASSRKLQAHSHPTGQHGSSVRAEHEFLSELCKVIEGVPDVLVTGSRQVLGDVRHYVEKHRPQAARHIVGYEVVGALTTPQRLAQARQFFLDRERLAPKASA